MRAALHTAVALAALVALPAILPRPASADQDAARIEAIVEEHPLARGLSTVEATLEGCELTVCQDFTRRCEGPGTPDGDVQFFDLTEMEGVRIVRVSASSDRVEFTFAPEAAAKATEVWRLFERLADSPGPMRQPGAPDPLQLEYERLGLRTSDTTILCDGTQGTRPQGSRFATALLLGPSLPLEDSRGLERLLVERVGQCGRTSL